MAHIRDTFDPKANDFGVLLDEIKALADNFYAKLNELNNENLALSAKNAKLSTQNEALNDKINALNSSCSDLKAENKALWQRARQRYDFCKNAVCNAENDLRLRLWYFDELKSEIDGFKRDELLAEKFFSGEFNARLWQLELDGFLSGLDGELNTLLKQAKQGYDIKESKAVNFLPTNEFLPTNKPKA